MLSATSFASVAFSLTQLPATQQCLVADHHCSQIKALVAGAKLKVLVGAQTGHPLVWISEGLREQREAGLPIRTLHLIAHGRPGAFRLGETWIDAEALKAYANELAHWGVETIALWSCHVGADADFVALLAELSGAQVLASADWLGRDGDGTERLQLGAWSLADVTDASVWPELFRLAPSDKDDPGIWFTADNGSHIYLNGKQLKVELEDGSTQPGTWDWREGFYLPLNDIVLRAGKNVLSIAGWDSEEIAGINGNFKFSDDVEIGTSTEGWKVYNADTVNINKYDPKGVTGLYSYHVEYDDDGNVTASDGSIKHDKFPDDEDALIDLFINAQENSDKRAPNIPGVTVDNPRRWTDLRFEMDDDWIEPGKSEDNPSPWTGQQTPDSTWLWYGERLAEAESDHPLGADKDPKNPWTYNNLSLFRFEFETKFRLEGKGFCEVTEEVDFGNPWQTANAEFEILFNDPLKSDERFSYKLVGDGDGGDFELLDLDLIAYDVKGKIVPGGVKEVEEIDTEGSDTYEGNIVVDAGVARVKWAASWKKTNGDLTGQESVTLTFEQGGGQSNGVITTDTKKVVLDHDGNGDWEENCPPAPPALGNEFELEASGSCETEEGSQVVRAGFTLTFKDSDGTKVPLGEEATFRYKVSTEGVPEGGEFEYESASVVAYGIGDDDDYVIEGGASYTAPDAYGNGNIVVQKDVAYIEISNEYVADYELTLNEAITLAVGHGDEQKVATTDPLGVDECPPETPPLENEFELEASGSCETEEGSQVVRAGFTLTFKDSDGNKIALQEPTTYKFNVSSSGVPEGGDFEFESASVVAYAGDQIIDDGVEIKRGPSTWAGIDGLVFVQDGVDRVEISNEYVANYELTLNESITLSLSNGDQGESATTNPLGEDECAPEPPPPLENEFELKASGSCETEEGSQVVRAGFTLTFGDADNDLLPPLKETTTYNFNVSSSGVPPNGSFEFGSASIVAYGADGKEDENGVKILDGPDLAGDGFIEVQAGVNRVEINNEYVANYELTGYEQITLSLTNGEQSEDAVTDELDLDDCPPIVPDEQEMSLHAEAACVVDEGLSDNTAEFTFSVDFDPSPITESIDLDYVIEPSDGLIDEDYAFNLQLSDGVSIKEGGSDGVLEVDEGVSDFKITITASSTDILKGDEEITLSLNDGTEVHQETASLAELDCAPEPVEPAKTDVELYLLMDNSTSMMQPDPSTAGANRRDRLESQARVSLYAYQQALEKAGYGFSRKGESGVLSEDDFETAVINNSAADLSDLLNGFEVIVNPDSEGPAEDLTVHLINYGYAVDYGSVQITADDPTAGTRAAQAIVDVKTPDQIYGNSIEGNSLWANRRLPKPTSNDTFHGDGRPASNLYSGTEMMGALEGLEHLLAAQAKRAGSDPITTYISMTTDGRPERRAWWDTRKGPGSDSLTGQKVRLPDALGGDAITTSGLLYDAQGNHRFLLNNVGKREWLKTQKRLNETLDAIAAQAESAEHQLQVSVMGMGDGTDADFPAIYNDLFVERTFNPSQGGWDYNYFTSYALPDFVG